jgi:hypothetical protein
LKLLLRMRGAARLVGHGKITFGTQAEERPEDRARF